MLVGLALVVAVVSFVMAEVDEVAEVTDLVLVVVVVEVLVLVVVVVVVVVKIDLAVVDSFGFVLDIVALDSIEVGLAEIFNHPNFTILFFGFIVFVAGLVVLKIVCIVAVAQR